MNLEHPIDDYPIVELTWVDANTQHGWSDSRVPGLAIVQSVGYLIFNNRDLFVLLSGYDTDASCTATFDCSLAIPAGCVERVKVLKEGKPGLVTTVGANWPSTQGSSLAKMGGSR